MIFQQQSSGSSDLKDTCSSDEEIADAAKSSLPSTTDNIDKYETIPIKRKRRKKKIVLPAEIKDKPYLRKYWHKRFSLFSKFDQGIQLDEGEYLLSGYLRVSFNLIDLESWFSVTPETVAKHHASRFKNFDIIVDGFCGVGGNAIQFASAGLRGTCTITTQLAIIVFCFLVIAVDIDPQKIQRARHNSSIYGVADKIEFIVGDFISLAGTLRADAVFLSPPWGGPSYLKQQIYELDEALQPVPFTELMNCAKKISNNIGIFLPRNSNTHTVNYCQQKNFDV